MANLITLGRLVLLFVAIALLYSGSYALVASAAVLTAAVFLGDGLDGYVARWRNSSSEFGALLDIAGDRVVENAYWIVFAQIGLIGVWAPLVVVTRGFFVDTMRTLGYAAGRSAFGENTMMRSRLTTFLTASRFMRALYGWSKGVGFVFLAGMVAARLVPGSPLGHLYGYLLVRAVGWAMVYGALTLAIVRGVPVLVDSYAYLQRPGGPPQGQ